MVYKKCEARIIKDPKCCGGEPIVRGTRVTLRAILASLAEGDRPEEVAESFPSLCVEDVHAAIAFASALSEEVAPVHVALLNA